MEGEILKICAVAILCGIVGVLLGKSSGIATAVRLGGLCAVFGGVLALLGSVVEILETFGIDGVAAQYTELMLKGVGLSVLCRLCADICRDCGEGTVALAVESAGKLGMVMLAMPVVADIVAVAEDMLDKV